jgi:hypothetical protein
MIPRAEKGEVPLRGAGSTSAAAEIPDDLATITLASVGTVKEARPVISVFTLCPPTATATFDASLPSALRIARVAGCPLTTFGGSRITTDPVASA